MREKIDNIIPSFLLDSKFRIYRHLFFFLIILVITVNIAFHIPGEIESHYLFLGWLIYFLIINGGIYINVYFLAPRLLLKNRLFYYFLSVAVVIVISIILIYILQRNLYDLVVVFSEISYSTLTMNIMSSIISIGLIIAGASTLLLFRQWMSYTLRIGELESSNLQSELKFLKNQINPHFLFNMLNNANVLIKKNQDEASQVLFKLEDLLRYQINDSSKGKVFLSSDIYFLNDFLNLEKIRRDKFEYLISKEGDISQISVPPLLFIPFVENAIKHNPDSENLSYVYLSFKIQRNELYFCCENSKPPLSNQRDGVGGLGLKNIHRRLELLFPDRYTLDIKDNETTYVVTLHIKL